METYNTTHGYKLKSQAPTNPQFSNTDISTFVSEYIDSISETLRPISLKIHDNPELCYEEFLAHETLTEFMKSRKGWKVTPSAYGIATAFIATYDSGKKGPVISYNAEYGKFQPLSLKQEGKIDRLILWEQTH